MKKLVQVEFVEKRVSKKGTSYWYAVCKGNIEVFCYDEVKPGDFICIETKITYCGKVEE